MLWFVALGRDSKEEAGLAKIIGETLETLVSHAHYWDGVTGTTSHWMLNSRASKLTIACCQPNQFWRFPGGPGHPDLLSDQPTSTRLETGEDPPGHDPVTSKHDSFPQYLGYSRQYPQ